MDVKLDSTFPSYEKCCYFYILWCPWNICSGHSSADLVFWLCGWSETYPGDSGGLMSVKLIQNAAVCTDKNQHQRPYFLLFSALDSEFKFLVPLTKIFKVKDHHILKSLWYHITQPTYSGRGLEILWDNLWFVTVSLQLEFDLIWSFC